MIKNTKGGLFGSRKEKRSARSLKFYVNASKIIPAKSPKGKDVTSGVDRVVAILRGFGAEVNIPHNNPNKLVFYSVFQETAAPVTEALKAIGATPKPSTKEFFAKYMGFPSKAAK